jgi:hypothetical protein
MITHVRIATSLVGLIGALLLGGAGPWAFRLAMLYLPIWAVLEFAHWAEQKAQTKCRTCDFDPFLYQKDWRAARVAVELRLNGIKSEMLAKTAPARAPEVVAETAH